jgi:hypothetical protein
VALSSTVTLSWDCQLRYDARAGVLIYIYCCRLLSLHTDTIVLQRDHAHIQKLSDRLIQSINSQVDNVVRNGDVNGYPGCVNLSFAYVEGESLLMALKVRLLTMLGIFG